MLGKVRQTMFDLFQFVADCREATVSDKSQKYLREVVARAVSENGLHHTSRCEEPSARTSMRSPGRSFRTPANRVIGAGAKA